MLKKLRSRRHAITRRLHRRQSLRHRLNKWAHWLRQHKRKALAHRIEASVAKLAAKITEDHDALRDVEAKIDAIIASRQSDRDEFVKAVTAQVGVVEGSATQRAWAADMGADWTWPWCSTFQGYFLKHVGGFAGRLPSGTPYSGSWLSWSHGTRISYSQAQPGDLLIFDWGDGGITDHVAMYAGGGLKVGGNENDRVEKDAVPVSNIVGVVRPNWDS